MRTTITSLQDSGVAVQHAYQDLLRALIGALIEPGDVVVDGGANIGAYTGLMAQRAAPSGRVLAFDPEPQALRLNKDEIARAGLSQYVTHYEAALADRTGTASLYASKNEHSYSSLSAAFVENTLRTVGIADPIRERAVDLVTLDSVPSVLRLDFLKLELEGAEFLALKGAARLLSSSDCFTFWGEGRGWPGELFGYGSDEFFDFFETIGYEPYTAFGERLTRDGWTDPQLGWYFYAHRPGYARRARVEQVVNQFWTNSIRSARIVGTAGSGMRGPTGSDGARVSHYSFAPEDQQQIVRWALDGTPGTAPEAVKRLTILDYLDRFGYNLVVETGTYHGNTSAALAASGVTVHTIELSEMYYRKACERFTGTPNVVCHHGDSGRLLPAVLDEIDQPAVLWLDGHYSMLDTAKGDLETPIVAELETVFARRDKRHVILIDDARCFGSFPDYPALAEVEEMVKRNLPGYSFSVLHDIIRILPLDGPQ
jgi:FkbM family methyltransferase